MPIPAHPRLNAQLTGGAAENAEESCLFAFSKIQVLKRSIWVAAAPVKCLGCMYGINACLTQNWYGSTVTLWRKIFLLSEEFNFSP
jgi:hypothetical protein